MFRLFVALAAALPALGQGDRGTIAGTITDNTGGAIVAAEVTVTHTATNVVTRASTNQNGAYRILSLPVGAYSLSVTSPGFQTHLRQNVVVQVNQTTIVDVELALGAVTETVTVEASVAPLIQTESSDVGMVVESKRFLDLPLALGGGIRNPSSFIKLSPGVDPRSTWNKSISGGGSFQDQTYYDGIALSRGDLSNDGEVNPSVDAIAEFKLITNNYSAEYSKAMGGITSFTMKSGTNEFHGTAFHFLRNDKLDARGFFAPRRVPTRQNEWGFTLGGPVVLPGYKGKDRTFWFFSYDQFYRRGGQLGGLQTLPTARLQQGDFGELPRTIYDPATSRTGPAGGLVRDPFPNQIIPRSRWSSVSSNIAQFLPQPALPGVVNNNPEPLSSPYADNLTWGFKLDHILSDRHRLSGMYNSTDRPRRLSVDGRVIGVGDPTALSSFNDQRVGTKVARINLNSTFSPTVLNHLGLGYGLFHNPNHAISFQQGWVQPNGGRLGLRGLQFDLFPRVVFSTDGYNNYGHTIASDNRFHTFTLMDTVSVIKGNHTLKFGGEIEHHQDNYRNFGNGAGTFQFRRDTTGLPGTANSGDAFAAFLLGETFSANAFFRDSIPGGRYTNNALFVDDQWRVTDRLTLNMGFRWEMIVPHSDPLGRISYMDVRVPNPGAGNWPGAMVYGGPQGFGNRYLDLLWWNPAPRFGFAYKLSGDFVVRGGVGIFNSNYINQGLGLPQFGFGTTAAFVSGDGGITPAFNWDNGFPQDFRRPPITEIDAANGQNVTAVLPSDFKLPRKLQWNLLLEKQFGGDISMSFGYVASKGTYLYEQQQINQIPDGATRLPLNVLQARINTPLALANGVVEPFPGFAQLWGGRATVAQALRPFPQFGDVSIYGSTYGNSSYHSFQHKLDKRYRGGVSGTLAYTWSKFLTDARQFDAFSGQQNQYLREKSYHPTDLTHILTFSLLYELPFGPNKRFLGTSRGVVGKLVGGWQISAVNAYNSGARLPITTNNTLPFFNLALRPDLVSSDIRSNVPMSSFDPATDVYLNRSAFAQPAPGMYGTAPRYLTTRGPMRSDESLGIFKNTRITERISHQFRVEVVNPLNRTVFGDPVTNFAAGNFGRIASTQVSPRNIQFGMKLIW